MSEDSDKKPQMVLPEELISSIDLASVQRELETLDESIYQTNLRTPGEPTKLVRSSRTVEALAEANKLSLLENAPRRQLIEMVKAFSVEAPRIHVSFAREPSAAFTRKLTFWLRENINPHLLLEVGLQPTIAAGCVVRTDNKIFDLSLRHHFSENRHLLIEKIKEHAA